MGWGRSTATCWLPSSDLACPCRITYRGAGDAGDTPDTLDHPMVFSQHRPRRGEQAQRRPRQPVHGRATTSEQLPCAQLILGPAGARLGKRTATRHDGIGTSPRHRCSRRYWGIGRSGDLGRSVVLLPRPGRGRAALGGLWTDAEPVRRSVRHATRVRDEEVAGSNPVRPTTRRLTRGAMADRQPTRGPLNDYAPEPRCPNSPCAVPVHA